MRGKLTLLLTFLICAGVYGLSLAQRRLEIPRLDLNAILAKIYKYSDGNTMVQQLAVNDSLISFTAYNPQKSLSYTVKDLKSGVTTKVNGDSYTGYVQEKSEEGSPIIQRLWFYPNGSIKSIEQRYTKTAYDVPIIDYPLGIKYLYSEHEKLIKTINYKIVFKFGYNDILVLLAHKDKSASVRTLKAITDKNKNFWELVYFSERDGLSILRIDGKSGKILNEMHHFQVVED